MWWIIAGVFVVLIGWNAGARAARALDQWAEAERDRAAKDDYPYRDDYR